MRARGRGAQVARTSGAAWSLRIRRVNENGSATDIGLTVAGRRATVLHSFACEEFAAEKEVSFDLSALNRRVENHLKGVLILRGTGRFSVSAEGTESGRMEMRLGESDARTLKSLLKKYHDR